MEKDRKFRALAIAAICVAVVGVSVAYAALSTVLNINGTATVNTKGAWDIQLKSPSCAVKSGAATCSPAASLTGTTTITWGATFTAPGDAVTVTASVANDGTIDAILQGIEKSMTVDGEGSQDVLKYLTYTVTVGNTTIQDGATLPTNKALLNKTAKNVTITVTFADDATNSLTGDVLTALNGTKVNFKLMFDFAQKTTDATEL